MLEAVTVTETVLVAIASADGNAGEVRKCCAECNC